VMPGGSPWDASAADGSPEVMKMELEVLVYNQSGQPPVSNA